MKKLQVILTVTSLLFVTANVHAQSECTTGESASPTEIVNAVDALCCSKAKFRGCIKKALIALKNVKPVLSAELIDPVRAAIIDLRDNSCDIDAITVPTCTDETSTTTTEAEASVDDKACDLNLRAKRRSKLNKFRRALTKARKYLDTDFVSTVRAAIKTLLGSSECGKGGKKSSAGRSCNNPVDPRDGANGNVYKQSDHGCDGVFVSHNGARSGTVLSTSGQNLGNLRYTGLANADPRGLRHHYRTPVCCSSLPSRFFLKIGSTCYEIDRRCGRID